MEANPKRTYDQCSQDEEQGSSTSCLCRLRTSEGDGKVKRRSLPSNPAVSTKLMQTAMEKATPTPGEIHRARVFTGELLWLTSRCSPDIAHAVSRLSITSHKPSKLFFQQCSWLVGYLLQRRDLNPGFKYCRRRDGDDIVPPMDGVSDASFDSVLQHRSHLGQLLFVGRACVDYNCSLSKVVTLSTTHSECISMSSAAKSMIRMASIMGQMGLSGRRELLTDNMSQFMLSQGGVNKRSAHISYRHRHLKDLVRDGFLITNHVSTKVCCADLLTKTMRVVKDFRFLRHIMMAVKREDDHIEDLNVDLQVDENMIKMLGDDFNAEEVLEALWLENIH